MDYPLSSQPSLQDSYSPQYFYGSYLVMTKSLKTLSFLQWDLPQLSLFWFFSNNSSIMTFLYQLISIITNSKKTSQRGRILEAAIAKAWSETNLQIQNLILSGGLFASPSAEWNNVCNTSPLKLWHNLSNICKNFKDQSLS